ncbi:MAG: hypothetical protein LQ344_005704 [Seirophora lacunosa]|nr:MAG: hypothetical protein LQ344_005704 [Seirophora lacunosa]
MPGKCFSKAHKTLIAIISDFFLSAFPILILRKVKISFRSKRKLVEAEALTNPPHSTGSLSLVRTVLNYQNVTNDPTWLSVPNWYWRTWEVLFGVVAACIPTLRPLYKWLLQEYTRLTTHSPEEPNTRSNRSWPRLKKYLPVSANKSNTDGQASASVPGSDMILPLQRFSGTGGVYEKAVEQEVHSGFDKGLHIHGDLEIHHSGNQKLERWDSEAQIGGRDGIKEVEDRI